jgi:hypothetical protein
VLCLLSWLCFVGMLCWRLCDGDHFQIYCWGAILFRLKQNRSWLLLFTKVAINIGYRWPNAQVESYFQFNSSVMFGKGTVIGLAKRRMCGFTYIPIRISSSLQSREKMATNQQRGSFGYFSLEKDRSVEAINQFE